MRRELSSSYWKRANYRRTSPPSLSSCPRVSNLHMSSCPRVSNLHPSLHNGKHHEEAKEEERATGLDWQFLHDCRVGHGKIPSDRGAKQERFSFLRQSKNRTAINHPPTLDRYSKTFLLVETLVGWKIRVCSFQFWILAWRFVRANQCPRFDAFHTKSINRPPSDRSTHKTERSLFRNLFRFRQLFGFGNSERKCDSWLFFLLAGDLA